MNLSTALRDGLLNHLFRGAASPRLDAYYVAFSVKAARNSAGSVATNARNRSR